AQRKPPVLPAQAARHAVAGQVVNSPTTSPGVSRARPPIRSGTQGRPHRPASTVVLSPWRLISAESARAIVKAKGICNQDRQGVVRGCQLLSTFDCCLAVGSGCKCHEEQYKTEGG